MKSKSFVTYEVDDPVIAAEEIYTRVADEFPLLKNSAGLLFSYSDMEVGDLAAELNKKLDMPIIGATAIATMDSQEGFQEMTANLIVLTADDCEFASAVSEPITPENIKDEIKKTYDRAVSQVSGKPGLAYIIPPYQLNIMLDTYTDTFKEIAPDVPFVGGLPSYNATGDENTTIYGGDVTPNRMVLLVISGNIRPVFAVQTILEKQEIKKRRVTKAENNIILEVDNMKFTDYLSEIGMPLESLKGVNKTISLVANPLIVEESRKEFGKDFRYIRALHDIDMEAGSGTAIGRVPQGSYISIHPLSRNEIGLAALNGMRNISEQIEQQSSDDYEYTTVLTVSCIGRYSIMMPKGGVETEHLLTQLPENLTLSGFYSYGEICPMPTPDGFISFSHNESLVICAF